MCKVFVLELIEKYYLVHFKALKKNKHSVREWLLLYKNSNYLN